MWFRNHYTCVRCGHQWTDEWSATCDDDCPKCGARHMSPHKSDDLTIIVDEEPGRFVVLHSADTAEHDPDYRHLADFPTKSEAESYTDGARERARLRETAKTDKAAIRELNDAFRKTFSGGKVVMTASVAALPDMVRANALLEVARFSNFTEENDPHGEHDFGNFQLVGRTFYWKIDLYNSTMDGGSEDPSDPKKTTRVLTVMLAEDY